MVQQTGLPFHCVDKNFLLVRDEPNYTSFKCAHFKIMVISSSRKLMLFWSKTGFLVKGWFGNSEISILTRHNAEACQGRNVIGYR